MTTVTVNEEIIALTEEVVETITVTVAEQGPPGVDADHSGLLNLDADDHLQYHTDARGDARYAALSHDHGGVYEPADADLQAHLISTSNPHSVTAAQVGADATGTAAGLIATHESAVNPHPGYLTPTEGDAAYAALSHDHSGVYEASGAVSTHAAVTSSVHGITTFGASLVDDADAGTARNTLGLGTAATTAATDYATAAHNHTGTYDPAGTASSAVSSHEGAADPHPGYALESSLGGAALLSVGTTTGTVAAGDDARFSTGTTGDAFASSHPGGNQHIDWTADQGATNLHAGNIPDLSGTYAVTAKGVTNGDSHDHSGGDGAQIAYSGLSGLPTLGTAAATAATDYATAAQGATADTAVQPGDDAADLGSGSATDGYVLTADGVGGSAWEAAAVTYAGAASEIHAATEKTTPVDADELGLVDSAASWVLKRLTWANIKTTLANFFTIKNQTNAVGIGFQALLNNTGQHNYAIGSYALTANTSAIYNTAIGSYALNSVVSSGQNTAIGSLALKNYTFDGNTAIGYKSQELNVSGLACVSIGNGALGAGACGNGNVAIGSVSLNATTGVENVGIGWAALLNNTTGSGNIAIGRNAGRFHANGSTALTDPEYSVYIGYAARGKNNADNNSVVIGGNAPIGLGENTTVIGTSATTLTRLFGNIGLGVDSPNAAIHAIKTTEQLRLGYDATQYVSHTVDSSGNCLIDAVGTVKIGSSTNYTQIATDGTLSLVGTATVWDDLSVPLTQGKQGNTDKPDYDYTNVGYLFPQNDATEILYMTVQLPHAWKEGSTIYPHVHWHQAANQNVTWKIDYRWTNIGEAPSGSWTTYTMSTLVSTYTSGTLNQISSNATGISGTGKTLSSVLQIRLYRDDNVYTGDALATMFDLHIELDSFGSTSEFTK